MFTTSLSFAQSEKKPTSNIASEVNEKEGTSINTHSIKYKKKPFVPKVIAPIIKSNASANCADNLGGNFTACEAGKKDR